RELPQAERANDGAGDDEPGRIELELRIAAPPVRIPVGGPAALRQAPLERVPEPEELPRMVVEGGQPATERGEREGDAIGEEEQPGQKFAQAPISAAGRRRVHIASGSCSGSGGGASGASRRSAISCRLRSSVTRSSVGRESLRAMYAPRR